MKKIKSDKLKKYVDPRLRHISLHDICPRDQWIKHNQRRECFLCRIKFSTLKRKYNCRVCGEVVCDSCTHKTMLSIFHRSLFEYKIRICMKCLHSKDKLIKKLNIKKTTNYEPPLLPPPPPPTTPSHSSSSSHSSFEEKRENDTIFWLTLWTSVSVFLTCLCDNQKTTKTRSSSSQPFSSCSLSGSSSCSSSCSSTCPSSCSSTSLLTTIPSDIPEQHHESYKQLLNSFSGYTSENAPWKLINKNSSVSYYKMNIPQQPPAHKIIAFIPSLTAIEFLDFISNNTKASRVVWDSNLKEHKVFEEHGNLTVFYNSQHPFLGGLVSQRDFCLLSYRKEDAYFMQSITHKEAPKQNGHVRGHMFFTGMKCDSGTFNDKIGFWFTYIVHADIKGSLPTNLVSNGTFEAMMKFIEFIQTENINLLSKVVK